LDKIFQSPYQTEQVLGQVKYLVTRITMRVIAIENIARKNVPIYYRQMYTGMAMMEIVNKTEEHRIEFSIETKPTGDKEITVTLPGDIHYPLIPVLRALKQTISAMHMDGELPD